MLTQIRQGFTAFAIVFSAISPKAIISFNFFLSLTPPFFHHVSILPIAVHTWFECDHASDTSTSAKRRKQLSIRATDVHSGFTFINVLVFRNVMTTPQPTASHPLILPLGSALASSE